MTVSPDAPALGEPLPFEPPPRWMRLILLFIGLLPPRVLPWLGAFVAFLAGGIVRVRRRHVVASMRRARVVDPARVSARMYRSLGVGLFELLWMAARGETSRLGRLVVTARAEEALSRALARGRGVVVATAHTGNWDLTACAVASWLSSRGVGFHVVTKRLSWRALDRLWQRLRAERGVGLVEAAGAMSRARDLLARGDVVAMMVDQVPERRSGVATFPFLGADARHDLAPVLIARRAKAPIVVAFGRRVGEGHEVDVVDVIEAGEGDAAAVMKRVAGALEGFVVAYPEQWMWLHRRWKRLDGRRE